MSEVKTTVTIELKNKNGREYWQVIASNGVYIFDTLPELLHSLSDILAFVQSCAALR